MTAFTELTAVAVPPNTSIDYQNVTADGNSVEFVNDGHRIYFQAEPNSGTFGVAAIGQNDQDGRGTEMIIADGTVSQTQVWAGRLPPTRSNTAGSNRAQFDRTEGTTFKVVLNIQPDRT